MAVPILETIKYILLFILFLPFQPKITKIFDFTYDYIIVGAGSAGSVVAARLSEDPCVKVLLLEAGSKPEPITEVPGFAIYALGGKQDWNYKTVPQRHAAYRLKNRTIPRHRGKGLGGSSLLNFMMYTRGNRRDYDSWAEQGADGWSWDEVFPYFLKSEDNTDPEISNNGYHNSGGYLTVSSLQYNSTLVDIFAKAGIERGYEYRDINAERQTGFYKIQGTLRHGRRCSTAKAFLLPAQDRGNLHIVDNTFVTKVLLNDNKEAYGVKLELDNVEYEVFSRKEVIVSAGSFNSPKLLMLSGLGPKEHLEQLGIVVVEDLPVGDNLQDHISCHSLHFEASGVKEFTKRLFTNTTENTAQFNIYGTGIYTGLTGYEGLAFLNSKYNDPSLDWPDFQINLMGFTHAKLLSERVFITDDVYQQVYAPYATKDTFTFVPGIERPGSRGTVRLASADPHAPPLIDMNLLQDPRDLEILVDAMNECVELTKTKAFQDIGAKMFQTKFPGCESFELYSGEYLRCLGRQYTSVGDHSVGTCKMGADTDATAVVDPRLRVRGVKNLRVVDGSIMPTVITGNTYAPIVMIGEKASDLIKEDNRHTCFTPPL